MRARRSLIIAAIIIPSGLILSALYFAFTYDPVAPRFEKVAGFTVPAGTWVSYNFLDPRPFASDTVWLTLRNRTNYLASALFDLRKRTVTGRLSNAQPLHFDAAHSRLLCMTRGPAQVRPLERAKAWASQVLGRLRVAPPKWLRPARPSSLSPMDDENYWVLDLNRRQATFIGRISQFRGAGSSFFACPDFRFAFNKPSSAGFTNLVYLLDIEKRSLSEIRVDGWPAGWWDDQTLVVTSPGNDVGLFNVQTGKRSILIPAMSITNFLDRHSIDHENQQPSPFLTWNGREFEVYITDTHRQWSAEESFLLKVERPDGRLAVVSPSFKFEWSDHFDEPQRHYVYTGRESGDRSDGVFLRDLQTGTNITLVTPRGEKTFSIPQIYGESVIYIRSNALWSVSFDGKRNERLFPP